MYMFSEHSHIVLVYVDEHVNIAQYITVLMLKCFAGGVKDVQFFSFLKLGRTSYKYYCTCTSEVHVY